MSDNDNDLSNVLQFPGDTVANIPPDRVLEGAKGQLAIVVVLGTTPDGELYMASSTSDSPELLWLVEQFKLRLLRGFVG